MLAGPMRASPAQLRLGFSRHYDPVLVGLAQAMEHTGSWCDEVRDMVASGALLWVWDLSTTPSRQHLRFWIDELRDPGSVRSLALPEVIERVVGKQTQAELMAATVGRILQMHPQQRKQLISAGLLTARRDGHPFWVTRQSVVDLLSARWLGR